MNEVAPKISSDYRPVARVGYAVIVLTFGLLGGWAALANIDSAVVSSGVVSVESKRKAVQHLEGGIVREINVTNGTRVDAGKCFSVSMRPLRTPITRPRAISSTWLWPWKPVSSPSGIRRQRWFFRKL